MLFFPSLAFSHAGSHGNDECAVTVGNAVLRLSGYQFQSRDPDRHFCRHFPRVGQTIIKLDSLETDLTGMSIELQLLKRQSWLGLIMGDEDAFVIVEQSTAQHFSKQVVSIEADIQERDVYALNMMLYDANGTITEQRFMFAVGIPFAQVMVAIAVLLLLFLGFIVLRQWLAKRQEQQGNKA